MGGMGFIENNKALCMLSVLTTTHMLVEAQKAGVERFFYSSSACVYAAEHQTSPEVVALRRRTPTRPCPRTATAGRSCSASGCAATSRRTSASRPASPATTTSTGPTAPGTAAARRRPAAICRKVAQAKLSGDHRIEIWGDGEQTRSFMYIDDCLEGTLRHHGQRHHRAAQPRQRRARHDQPARRHRRGHRRRQARAQLQPRRAAGRARPQQRQHADPRSSSAGRRRSRLEDGLEQTYRWVYDQLAAQA